MMKRCVNLDWLEVFVFEPVGHPRDPYYFLARGILVNVREYGTPVYNQMFTVMDDHNNPFIEVRRDPKSQLMCPEMCHLRLHNSYCYRDNAAQLMEDFIQQHDFLFQRISRVDVCLDFEKFDSGDDPQSFLYRYINRVYSKINQANLTTHGTDTWTARQWNSLSWGSPTSQIGTKFYNKTMELYDTILQKYKKPYIRYAWQLCGLVDDWQTVTKKKDDGSVYTPQIWRVEFSIRSSVKKWFEIELDGHQKKSKGRQKYLQSVRNTLDMYKGRDRLLVMFAALARHYFHFKFFKEDVRKDRCPDKVLFRWGKTETTYIVGRDISEAIAPVKPDRPLVSLLNKLRQYRQDHDEQEIRSACDVLIRSLEDEELRHELNSPFSRLEITALRQALAINANSHQHRDAGILIREIRDFLKLNERTLPFDNGK